MYRVRWGSIQYGGGLGGPKKYQMGNWVRKWYQMGSPVRGPEGPWDQFGAPKTSREQHRRHQRDEIFCFPSAISKKFRASGGYLASIYFVLCTWSFITSQLLIVGTSWSFKMFTHDVDTIHSLVVPWSGAEPRQIPKFCDVHKAQMPFIVWQSHGPAPSRDKFRSFAIYTKF